MSQGKQVRKNRILRIRTGQSNEAKASSSGSAPALLQLRSFFREQLQPKLARGVLQNGPCVGFPLRIAHCGAQTPLRSLNLARPRHQRLAGDALAVSDMPRALMTAIVVFRVGFPCALKERYSCSRDKPV